MSVNTVSGTTATGSTPSNAFGAMSSDQFLKVMLTELSHQDPLQPQDSAKLLEQFSSLRNIESQLQLQTKLGDLVLQYQIAAAGTLIGRLVAGMDEDGARLEGKVTSVRVLDGQAYLELDTGRRLSMSRLTEIAQPVAAQAA